MKNSTDSIILCQDKMFSELYSLNTLVNMTKNYCQELEFKGEYYGGNKICVKKISEERNEYLTMLSLIRNKLDKLINLNVNLEKELYISIPTIAADK